MDEKKLEELIKSIDTIVEPPADMKIKILDNILIGNDECHVIRLSRLERFFFEKPLKAACIISVAISGVLWAAFGNGYAAVLINFAGSR